MRAVVQRVSQARVRVDGRVIGEIGQGLLAQFTRYGDTRGQRRPSFIAAAPPDVARPIYEDLVRELRTQVRVETGEFQAMMQVELVNDGPVTLLIDSRRSF
jgi:D-tyrosyl-tRNA(Tyr) deacylase